MYRGRCGDIIDVFVYVEYSSISMPNVLAGK